MGYFFYLPHLSAPSSSILLVLQSRNTCAIAKLSWKKKWTGHPESSLQRMGLRHPPWNSSEKNIRCLCPLLNALHLEKAKQKTLWQFCRRSTLISLWGNSMSHTYEWFVSYRLSAGWSLAVSCSSFLCLHADGALLKHIHGALCVPGLDIKESSCSSGHEER